MAKGDDAVRRKKNKSNRKKMQANDVSSARVTSIIASKRRRKDGKRRRCEGMCFSLPTPEDPFNDRFDNPRDPRKLVPHNKNKRSPQPKLHQDEDRDKDHKAPDSDQAISKFLILCLNAIQDAWAEEGSFDPNLDAPLLSGTWGFRLWRRCSAPQSDFIDINGVCANREQIAWLVSTASDIFAAKEKQGLTVPSPFLLYLVPSQQKALQVRSVCKPLKALGIHTVSVHTGASLDHQVRGLKSCDPEFLVSTPERLLQLVSQSAIDISGISFLVIDGLINPLDTSSLDKLQAIIAKISKEPHVVVFTDGCGKVSMSMARNLFKSALNTIQ
ncbi:uncharacterized protein LOC120270746 [Dioscorea cayenensis subsp. rotundata]|uniref:Uncharacterized protein LOC120270746 n=1 Tax=Dioscorea cayennensis subsp. rotundata TaxID=55577 RepID=A0AB40C1X0_DIOCR|nr:uncharacterized protein LOC120270746 [Dioscorea cayenensis subsp. rotundata]